MLGSFFNVVAWRVPRGMSVVHPPSHCPGCKTPIPFYRNVPVVTWLLQLGRCAVCGCGIPTRYVLVEAVCAAIGGLWCVLALRGVWPEPSLAAGWIAFAMVGVPISLIDWDTFEIPDGLVVVAFLSAAILRISLAEDVFEEVPSILGGALMSGGFLYALSFGARVGLGWWGSLARRVLRMDGDGRHRHRMAFALLLRWARFDRDTEALGLGDVSLALAAGAALGFPSVAFGLPIAAILGVAGHLLRPRAAAVLQAREAGLDEQALPFGPFLVGGFLLASILLSTGILSPG
jgi:prepilin signal peptidase PulO-like enzyme (type II secretory pathway)